jgi:hypothetical protein
MERIEFENPINDGQSRSPGLRALDLSNAGMPASENAANDAMAEPGPSLSEGMPWSVTSELQKWSYGIRKKEKWQTRPTTLDSDGVMSWPGKIPGVGGQAISGTEIVSSYGLGKSDVADARGQPTELVFAVQCAESHKGGKKYFFLTKSVEQRQLWLDTLAMHGQVRLTRLAPALPQPAEPFVMTAKTIRIRKETDWILPPSDEKVSDKNSPCVTVDVRVALKKITRVDTVQSTAYVKMGLVFYWNDSRLVGGGPDQDIPDQLWCPMLLLTNTSGTEFYSSPDGLHLIDADTGRLKRGYNYEGYVEWSLYGIADFPFDVETLGIRFYTESNWSTPLGENTGMDPKNRVYRLREVQENCGEGTYWWQGWDGKINEWHLHGYSSRIGELPPTPSGALGTEMKINIHISRRSYYYVTKLLFPLLTMAGMSFYSFALDVSDLNGRFSFMATLFLANISMIFVIGETMPKGLDESPIDRIVMLQLVAFFFNCAMHVVLSMVNESTTSTPMEIKELQSVFFGTMGVAYGFIYALILPPAWRHDRSKAKLTVNQELGDGFKYVVAKK